MVAEATEERELSSVAQALFGTVSELVLDTEKRVYAVVDGSQFKGLPQLLRASMSRTDRFIAMLALIIPSFLVAPGC